ncbi:YbaB/EbfC family nucleoid-associated protein [Nocardia sp. NPDC050175]|uniref:YbaB/EbfC family nucleoid-associated protein n=1 Tax=Nocardia sp. NPDC050175 TaxID=3364317 RepID=UPI00379FD454
MINPENRRLAEDASGLLDAFGQTFGHLAELARSRAELTASASAERGRITVTVNASGSIIATKFAGAVDDLSYSQIARATLQAAQRAAAKITRKEAELRAPLIERQSAMPRLEDMFSELAELRKKMPKAVPAPLTPPSERNERPATGHRILDRDE